MSEFENMTVRMITVCESVMQRDALDMDRKTVMTYAYITDMTVPEFVARKNASVASICKRYAGQHMRGWYHIVNVVELGVFDPAEIGAMESVHFSASLWLRRNEQPIHLDAIKAE